MTYKTIILVTAALLVDYILSVFLPAVAPLALVVTIFFLSKRLSFLEVLLLSLSAGFLYDLAQLSHGLYATIFLSLEALAIRFSSKKYFDFTNKFTQILALFIIFFVRVLSTWVIYDRAVWSSFLKTDLTVSLILTVATSLIILYIHGKKI